MPGGRASQFSARKAMGQVTFMMVFIQKNKCVCGVYVIFMGILMRVLKANSTVWVLVVFKACSFGYADMVV